MDFQDLKGLHEEAAQHYSNAERSTDAAKAAAAIRNGLVGHDGADARYTLELSTNSYKDRHAQDVEKAFRREAIPHAQAVLRMIELRHLADARRERSMGDAITDQIQAAIV